MTRRARSTPAALLGHPQRRPLFTDLPAPTQPLRCSLVAYQVINVNRVNSHYLRKLHLEIAIMKVNIVFMALSYTAA